MNRKFLYRIASVIGLGLFCTIAAAADYSGKYEGAGLVVVIVPDGTSYNGEVQSTGHKYPLTAHEDGNHLAGAYLAAGKSISFTATQQGDELIVLSGEYKYQLHRRQNPLAVRPADAGPADVAVPATGPAAQGAEPLANYIVMTETDAGRSLMRELPNVKTTTGAMRVAFPDLTRFFGVEPTLLGGYEDRKQHRSIFVSFSAKLNGQPVKGMVTAKVRDQGTVVFVVYVREDASRAAWVKLISPAAIAEAKEPDTQTQMDAVPLRVYNFPDGTGAVGVAEGWTTNAQTESNLLLTGPADQKVRMAMGGVLYVPNSQMVRQNEQMHRNGQGLNLAVAPYSADPAIALTNFIRANSIVSQRKGGPTFGVERIINVNPLPSTNPGAHAAQITYDIAVNEKGGVKHNRVFIQFETSAVTQLGTWGYYVSLQLTAPQETFKQDYPIMMAQAFSMKENPEVIYAKSAREIHDAKKLADAQHAAADKLAKARYSLFTSRTFAENELIKRRGNDDFIETLRGVRTVEDTKTGERMSVDLGDVHQFVDNANHFEPDRFIEIPLRDKFHPYPGHENEPDYLAR